MTLIEIEIGCIQQNGSSSRINSWRSAFLTGLLLIGLLFFGVSDNNSLAVDSQSSITTPESSPYLVVLGVVQDAGYPQAGCYLKHCLPGWEDPRKRRGAVSLALIDNQSKQKLMIEATPDFAQQFYNLNTIAPDSEYQFSGIFLTHAHIGHYAGLMHLGKESMNASQVPVYAMPRMADFLSQNGPWSQLVDFKNIQIQTIGDGQTTHIAGSTITPFLVPHRDEYSETVGFRISGPNKKAVFIPDINKWSAWGIDISEVVRRVDYALLDATFFSNGELPGRDMSKIPHPFVSETVDALKELSMEDRNKVWFIHMNHTNPLLDSQSKEAKFIKSEGFNVAVEGTRLGL